MLVPTITIFDEDEYVKEIYVRNSKRLHVMSNQRCDFYLYSKDDNVVAHVVNSYLFDYSFNFTGIMRVEYYNVNLVLVVEVIQ